jgi:hypothetical protein
VPHTSLGRLSAYMCGNRGRDFYAAATASSYSTIQLRGHFFFCAGVLGLLRRRSIIDVAVAPVNYVIESLTTSE